jgi:putative oxidoreductase
MAIKAELGRLTLRGLVGGTMVAHGVKHGRTQQGTAGWFASLGFREPELQAKLSAAVEVASGGALLAGAGTPFGSSAVVGIMAVAFRTVHIPNGFFITAEGYEYVLNLAALATTLAALGPGRVSLDRLLGLDRRLAGVTGAALAAGLGVGTAAAQLKAYWSKPEPEPAATASA